MRALDIRKLSLISFALLIALLQVSRSEAQSIEILGGNTLNGALNGTILGGATMALKSSNDFDPVRIGLGLGTLYGVGVGIYDLSQVSAGAPYYISGTFNDGNNTSIIVLLDTFYGAAGGAVIASAFQLIANEPLVEGLQYGSGVGAFVGFGFGLIDGFVLAQTPGDFGPSPNAGDDGMVSLQGIDDTYKISVLNPTIYTLADITATTVAVRHTPGIRLFSLGIRL